MLAELERLILRHPVYDLCRNTHVISGSSKQHCKRKQCDGSLHKQQRMHTAPFTDSVNHPQQLKYEEYRPHLLNRHRSDRRAGNRIEKPPEGAPLHTHVPSTAACFFRRSLGKHIFRKCGERPYPAGKRPCIKDRAVDPHSRITDRLHIHQKITGHHSDRRQKSGLPSAAVRSHTCRLPTLPVLKRSLRNSCCRHRQRGIPSGRSVSIRAFTSLQNGSPK